MRRKLTVAKKPLGYVICLHYGGYLTTKGKFIALEWDSDPWVYFKTQQEAQFVLEGLR